MLQTQLPQAQLALHVSVPLVQACVAPGEHAPPPVHDDHADHTPLVHVRVCVPWLQLPHACIDGPLHAHTPPVQVDPLGQALPHEAQLPLSLLRSTHLPLQ